MIEMSVKVTNNSNNDIRRCMCIYNTIKCKKKKSFWTGYADDGDDE